MDLCGRWEYDTVAGTHKYAENKDPHYGEKYIGWDSAARISKFSIGACKHTPKPPSSRRPSVPFDSIISSFPPPVALSTELTVKNSNQRTRRTQAKLHAENGYTGPIKAGEVRCLKNLLAKLGKTDHVVHGWRLVPMKNSWGGKYMSLRGPCYLFKSPIPTLTFADFIMLARMYKDGKGLKHAVAQLLPRIPAELKHEAETFRTIDVLAGLGETA